MSRPEELINALTRDLTPVRSVPALRRVVGSAVFAAAVCGAVWVARYGWGQVGGGVLSVGVGTTLVAIGAGGLLWGLAASVPGRDRASRSGRALFALGAVPILVGATFGAQAGTPVPTWLADGLVCLGSAALLAAPSALLSGYFVLRAAPARPLAALALVCVGSAALGAIGMHFACPLAEYGHLLTWHTLAPLGAGAALLAALSVLSSARGWRAA